MKSGRIETYGMLKSNRQRLQNYEADLVQIGKQSELGSKELTFEETIMLEILGVAQRL